MTMPALAKAWLVSGALAAALAVVLGAFGAHALKARVSAEMLAVWNTGVQYHFWHALGLLGVGLLAVHQPQGGGLSWAGGLLAAGIVLFSGSLYLLALGAPRGLGIVTPLGGLAFVLGWIALAAAVLRA